MAESRIDLGRTVTGVVVREGAPFPTFPRLRLSSALSLDARSVAYTDPKAGGSGGIMFCRACCRSSALPTRSTRRRCSERAAMTWQQSIAEGRAEIGTTFISEVLPVKGAKVVGPLPGELHSANTYTAAVIHARPHAKAAEATVGADLTEPATPPALDGCRPGARVSSTVTILRCPAGLPNYAGRGARRPWTR